jgi:hypothetical protein
MIQIMHQTGDNGLQSTSSKMDFITSCGPLRKRAFPFCSTTEILGQESHVAKRRKTKKSVQFGATTQGLSWYVTEEDAQRAWYCDAEYDSFKDECREVLMNVDAVKGDLAKVDGNKYCLRGLEDQIAPRVYYLRRKRKKSLIQMVLRQQDLHRQMGISNPQKLHTICEMYSKHSKYWALKLATLDADSCTSET